jgi:uncharacterized protein YbaP (TraB family)
MAGCAVALNQGDIMSTCARESTRSLVLASIRLAAGDVYQPELFQVASPTNVLFLLGSYHVGKPEMYPLPKPIEDKFGACGILLLEVYERGDFAGQRGSLVARG